MRKFQYNLGVIFISVLVFIPIVLWFLARLDAGVDFTHIDSSLFIQSLGQILGITGFMLFAVNIILASRMSWLENIFYGLNKVYEHHARIGKVAFYLMLFHPFTVFVGYSGFTTEYLLQFFTPTRDNWAVNWGIFAYFLAIILIVLTIYFAKRKLVPYHIWKMTHQAMGVVFFFATLHAFMIPSDVSNYVPLKYYIFATFFFAIFSYLYHTVLGKFLVKKYKYVVSQVRVLGAVTEVSLSPLGKKMSFTPGQFAFISFVDDKVKKESHPFSLTSYPTDETISFNMKNLGDYTSTLSTLSVGSKAYIQGPFGKFAYTEGRNKNQVWIAGGIGVTPFLSMIKSLKATPEYSVDMLYCLKNESEAIHLDDLKLEANDKVRILPHFSDKEGFINAEIINKEVGGLENKDVFLCAPPVMINMLRKGFIKLGVPSDQIHSEEFKLF